MAKVFHVLTASLLLAVSAGSMQAQVSEGGSRYLKQPMPESWAFTQEVSQTLPSDDEWWKAFGDSTLDSLISLGIDNNYNIKEAAHRREMARLAMQETKAGYLSLIHI